MNRKAFMKLIGLSCLGFFASIDAFCNEFYRELLRISQNTEQSFHTVMFAAHEFSRRGLNQKEVLKRTNAVMILSKLSGLSVSESARALDSTIRTGST